jgi:hypothetical protein
MMLMMSGKRSRLRWTLTVAVISSVALALSIWGFRAEGTDARGLGRLNPYKRFHLWKDVPGRSFARLGEGSLPNQTLWGVYASRVGSAAASREFPCVSVATITRHGIYGDATECGRPTPEPGGPPVIVVDGESGTKSVGGAVIGESALGAVFTSGVVKVKLVLDSGEGIVRQTSRFSMSQQQKTGLIPFRYIAFATMRDACVASMVGFGASGERLFDLPTELGC